MTEPSNLNPMPPGTEQPIELREAAAYLLMSPSALREKAKAGKVPAFKPGKRWLFLASELDTWLRSLMVGKANESKPITTAIRSTKVPRASTKPTQAPAASQDYLAILGKEQ